jgi:hypothetical protein
MRYMRVEPTASTFIGKIEIRECSLQRPHSLVKERYDSAAYSVSFIDKREITECSLQRLHSFVKERYESAAYSVSLH